MRKHISKLIVLTLIALLAVGLVVGLVACNDGTQPSESQTPSTEHTQHTPDSTTEWHSDETDHWHLCVEGGEPLSKAAHDFVLQNDNEHHYLECTVCHKRKDVDGHNTVVKSNNEGHWTECTKEGCTYRTELVPHVLGAKGTADSDGEHHTLACTYEGCEYTEQSEHTLSYVPDQEGGHHAVCADCNYVGENEACVKGEDVAYTDAQDGEHHTYQCAKCEATVTEAHDLGSYRLDLDSNEHYKQCTLCHAETERAEHTTVERTTEAQHWTECGVCKQQLTAPASHNMQWKDTEDHKQHYEVCTGCSMTFGEPQDHAHDGWTDDGDTCSFTCSTCKLKVTAPHDYTESASCINCEHDDPKWTLKDNEDDTYTLVAYNYNTNLAEFQGTEDAPLAIELPKTYKGKPIVALDNNNGATFYQGSHSVQHSVAKLVIPEGYKTIGDFTNRNGDGKGLTVTVVYLPSTVESVATVIWRGKALYITDVEKFVGITIGATTNNAAVSNSLYLKGEDGEYELVKEYIVPEGVTEIKNRYAFMYFNIDVLSLPSTLQSINVVTNPYSNIGTLKLKTLQQALTIDLSALISANSSRSIIIEDLDEQGLTEEFHIPETITTIQSGQLFALEAFNVVTKLYIHDEVTSLGSLNFANVSEVHFESNKNLLTTFTNTGWNTLNGKKDGLRVFVGTDEISDLVITDDMLGEGDTFKSIAYTKSLKTVKFETTKPVTFSSNGSFIKNYELKSVDFGNLQVANETFPQSFLAACPKLEGVVKLPEGPTKISNGLWFENDPLVTDIILPLSLTDLSSTKDYAFKSTSANIIFQKDAKVQDNITWATFYNWEGTTLVLPKEIKNSAKSICGVNTTKSATSLKRIFYTGTEKEWTDLRAQLATVSKPDVSNLVNATALAYAEVDPGTGNNAYTWAYDENGTLKEWYPEPECEGGHNFEYQSDDAQHWGQCSKCQYQLNHSSHVADPEKVGHDESQCWDVCSICEKEFGKADHTPGTEYKHDAAGHQLLCTRCGEPAETVQPHIADESQYKSDGAEHWRLCKDCGEAMEHTAHVQGETYGHDDSTHWLLCKDCEAKIDSTVTAHDEEGSAVQDSSNPASGHRASCSTCGQSNILVAHTYTEDGDGYKNAICTKCNYTGFKVLNNQIIGYSGTDIEKIIIPSVINGQQLTGIRGMSTLGLFSMSSNVKSIKFPDDEQFTSIGDKAFIKNSKIEEITFSKHIATVGVNLFEGCTSLHTVTFPADCALTALSNYMFYKCTSLQELTIPDSITTLGSNLFDGCTQLTTVNFPKTSEVLTTLSQSMFSNCTSLTSIEIPSYITTISTSAFSYTSIERLVIPDSVTSIASMGTVASLKYLEVGTGVTSITSLFVSGSGVDLETVWFKGVLTSLSSTVINSKYPETSEWYFSNDVESLKTLLASNTNAARVLVFAKSETNPADSEVDLGDKIDDGWRIVDGQPKRWGDYIMFKQLEYSFDLNSGVDDKTLDVSTYLRKASGAVSYKSNDLTVSGEGVVTFTKPGYFTVTAYVTGHEDVCVELQFTVYSSENYLVGTIGGNEVSAKQDDLTFKAGTGTVYTLTVALQENDKLQIAATGVSDKYGATLLTEETYDFLTKGDDGVINFTVADTYMLTLTYSEEGVSINIIPAKWKLALVGRQNTSGTITTKEFRPTPGGNTTVTINLTYNMLNPKAYPDFKIVVTSPSGKAVEYNTDRHGMAVSGDAYRSSTSSGFWCTSGTGQANFWYQGNITSTQKWTLTFTIDSEGNIVSLVLDKA